MDTGLQRLVFPDGHPSKYYAKWDRVVGHLNEGDTAERLSPVGGSMACNISLVWVKSKATVKKPASERW